MPLENLPAGAEDRVWPKVGGSLFRDFGGKTIISHFDCLWDGLDSLVAKPPPV